MDFNPLCLSMRAEKKYHNEHLEIRATFHFLNDKNRNHDEREESRIHHTHITYCRIMQRLPLKMPPRNVCESFCLLDTQSAPTSCHSRLCTPRTLFRMFIQYLISVHGIFTVVYAYRSIRPTFLWQQCSHCISPYQPHCFADYTPNSCH